MVTCRDCKSTNVRVNNGNFARVKPEGAPAAKAASYDIRFFYCDGCGSDWKSNPESQQDYYEYVRLRDRTEMHAQDMKPGGAYTAVYIDPSDLERRDEFARKLVELHSHVLDLSPSEWHQIRSDAQD